VIGFKLDDKTIYAWFREDLEPWSSSTSSLLLKKKVQNNFGCIQHKECPAKVEDGKSQIIASNLKTDKLKLKPRKSKNASSTLSFVN
jgi:hypothetical protein